MARHIPLPSFLSTKRSKVITAATAGTLTLTAAISTAVVAVPSSASPAPASASAAFMTATGRHAAGSAERQVATNDIKLIFRSKVEAFQNERAAQAAAKAAAARKAAAAKAAARAAAKAAAARKAAAAKAAAKAAAAKAAAKAAQPTHQAAVTVSSGSPEQIAENMLSQYGWSTSQFSCLQPLWARESGWNVTAQNPSSGAYGIPQALPGSKMASAGGDWQTDPATQIRWGLNYIRGSYGSPCGAWAHEQADGWY